jgi:hypothetical protein
MGVPADGRLLDAAKDQNVAKSIAGDLIYCLKSLGKWPKPTPEKLRAQNRERVRRFRARQRGKHQGPPQG